MYYLAKHNYEPGLNGQGRELLVRKDVHNTTVKWDLNFNYYEESNIDGWLNSTFFNSLDSTTRSLIGTTKFTYTERTAADTLERAVFLLSATELGKSGDYVTKEGSRVPISGILQIAHYNGEACVQFTRSPKTLGNGYVWVLSESGGLEQWSVTRTSAGVRPIFTVPSNTLLDENLSIWKLSD